LRFWLRYIRHIRLAQQGVLRPSGDSGAMVGPVTCKPHTPRPVGSGDMNTVVTAVHARRPSRMFLGAYTVGKYYLMRPTT
jgi:hypothetical protein